MRAIPIIGGLVSAIVLIAMSTSAQQPSATGQGHPLIGTWVVTVQTDQPTVPRERLMTFFADGNAIATDSLGRTWHGEMGNGKQSMREPGDSGS
jgi:hypothetical protein